MKKIFTILAAIMMMTAVSCGHRTVTPTDAVVDTVEVVETVDTLVVENAETCPDCGCE